MTSSLRPQLNSSLWTVQVLLAASFELSGLLKAFVPAADLQERLGFMTLAQPGILPSVGVVELVLSLALVLPAATRVLPRLTPVSAACLGASALLGLLQPASAGGLGASFPDLLLVGGAAFVAWGRLVAAPIEPATFGPEPEVVDPETAARLERNRQRFVARRRGERGVA